MASERDTIRLIESVHRAALDPSAWQGVAVEIDRALGSGGVAIHSVDTAARTAFPVGAIGFDPGYLDSYLAHFGAISPWPEKFMTMPRGRSRHSFMDLAEEDYIRTAGPGPRSLIPTVNLRRRDRERLEGPSFRLFNWLHLHIAHASAVNDAIARLSAQALGQRSQVTGGVVIVSDDRILLWADAGAIGLLGPLLRMTQIGRLTFVDPDAQNWFEALIAGLRHRGEVGKALTFQIRDGQGDWSVRAARCDTVTPHLPHLFIDTRSDRRALALVIEQLGSAPAPADRLRQRFGLTLAEAEVALRLAEGRTTEEIAALRNASRNTVRNQIQSVLWKMEARTRGDVIRAVSRLLDTGDA